MTYFPQHVEVLLHFLTTAAGGRIAPVASGYRGHLHYNGQDWDAIHTYPDIALAHPGDTVRAFLGFPDPEVHLAYLHPDTPILIREGARTVAHGRVISLLPSPDARPQGTGNEGAPSTA